MRRLVPAVTGILALALVAAFAAPLPAQPGPCFLGPDGFDTGCCNPAQPNLPQIPQISLDGKHGCLLNCGLEQETPVSVTLGPVSYVTCDLAIITVIVTPTSPLGPAYTGAVLAKYARTWIEPGPFGPRQVWRFLVNGDLIPAPAPGTVPMTPCPYPPIVATPLPQLIHFFGSIDYACIQVSPTGPLTWRFRLDLTHGPGCIQHAPWTARPLPASLRHDDRSYHILAPATFVFAPVPEPQGPIVNHAIRRSVFGAAGYQCLSRSQVVQGNLLTIQDDCLCVNIPPMGPWHHQDLVGVSLCAGMMVPFHSVPVPGTPFLTGLVSLSLGVWMPTGMDPWPAPRELVVYHGLIEHPEPCVPGFPLHIVHGVGTRGEPGEILSPAGPVPMVHDTFIDLCNHLSLGLAFGAPAFGELTWSDLVFSLNTP